MSSEEPTTMEAGLADDTSLPPDPVKGPTYATDNYGHHMKVDGKHEYVRNNNEFRHGYFASVMTLCLAVMGGAVLPVPWAFSITGATAGAIMCLVVAAANVFTSDLLIRQCYKTGSRDYEDLSYAVGGIVWLVVTRVSILVLLFGSIIAAIQQSGESALFALQSVTSSLPDWVSYSDDTGYVLMVLFTFGISFPLCLFKELRSLEYAGVVGFFVVIFLTGAVVVQSIAAGLPALKSGDFPAVGFNSMDNIAQAVSILGFAFYIQPLMMPLLNEMPGPARTQARILSWAMRFVVVVFAGGVYFFIGFFGAAWYGANTQENILQNTLLGGYIGQCIINFLMAIYLSLSLPPLEFCTRTILSNWIPRTPFLPDFFRNLIITLFTLCAALSVALFWQTGSGKMLVITGSSGVLMASYVCPIVNHFLLYLGWAKCQRHAEEEYSVHLQRAEGSHYGGHAGLKLMDEMAVPMGEALPPIGNNAIANVGRPGVLTYARDPSDSASVGTKLFDFLTEVVVPVSIVALGVFCSVVALYATFKPESADAASPAPAPAPAPA